MSSCYYDPMFYLCSEEMPFTIRIELHIKETVDGAALSAAVNEAIRRYPYFSVEVIERDGEWVTIPNPRPIAVYPGPDVLPLGGEEVGRHLLALMFEENRIHFCVSHVITDGAGFMPMLKSTLYYYFCRRENRMLDPAGIRLADSPFLPDELGNPYPEDAMRDAQSLTPPVREFFRLTDGGYVTDDIRTVFRVRVPEEDILRFGHGHDASPCALVSSLMAQAVWQVHSQETRDLVSAVSFNLRPGLGNRAGYRMLCNALPLRYPARLRNAPIDRVCTCTRGMVTLQSQPENVLAYAQRKREEMTRLLAVPGAKQKQAVLAPAALADAVNNTFSVSYVGKPDMGCLTPYLDAAYNLTDGSTYRTAFIEIASMNGYFDLAFIQGFSNDVYYRVFLHQLALNGLCYTEEGAEPLATPGMILPE